jgi:hypothetical protein
MQIANYKRVLVSGLLGLARRLKAKALQASTFEFCDGPEMPPQRQGCWEYLNPIGVRSYCCQGKLFVETF